MKKLLFILSLLLILVSCSDKDSTDSGDLFSIKIIDVDGNPVSGLDVGVNNAGIGNYFDERPANTVHLDIAQNCHCSFKIYDIKNNLVKTIIDTPKPAGLYSVTCWLDDEKGNSLAIGGTNLFKYEIILTDTSSNNVIFQDAKYMCYHDPTRGLIGTTDENGEFSFNNKLAFPHLFNMGEQPHIDEDGASLGTFILSDSINIRLFSPTTDQDLIFTVKMTSENNHYELVWEIPEELKFEQSRGVDLTAFNAEFANENLTIFWETQSETDNAGWNVYRGESDQFVEAFKINNELIDGNGTTIEVSQYQFVDQSYYEFDKTYWYWIESVDYNENTEVFGPISIDIPESPDDPQPPQIWENNLYQNYPNPFN